MKNPIIFISVITVVALIYLSISNGELATEFRTFLRSLLRALF
ncbi:hypothetical protein COO59_10655 [Mixta theicola]|uniref:Uncharacterized protein n=1 Tax=Mixta theicola TaxID=1458355 RepID=A0A2K1Q8X8_9GAMM|nr:hypothetical protein [Mixta theicola]PNS11484.1 hypothetical protein COO59_10655 [Mixta theicola]